MDNHQIGQIMIEQNVLTQEQVDRLLADQLEADKPFGQLAETMYGIDEHQVHQALADQIAYRAPQIKLCQETFEPDVLAVITAREAWDTLVLPIRVEDGELLCATTVETLPAAIELLSEKLDRPYRFALAEMRPIEEFIANMYAYEGVDVADDSEAA